MDMDKLSWFFEAKQMDFKKTWNFNLLTQLTRKH